MCSQLFRTFISIALGSKTTCHVVKQELAVGLSVLANLEFIREVNVIDSNVLKVHRWAHLEDRQQQRHLVVDFLTLAQHIAWRQARELRHQIVHYNDWGAHLHPMAV